MKLNWRLLISNIRSKVIKRAFKSRRDKIHLVTFSQLESRLGLMPGQMEAHIECQNMDLTERLLNGTLADMIRKATEFEPLICRTPYNFQEPSRPINLRGSLVSSMINLQQESHLAAACAVVVVPHVRMSGAARVASELCHALANIHGPKEVVLLRTDLSDMDFPGWFPAGIRSVDFHSAAKSIPQQDRDLLLFQFLRSLAPRQVINVNSRQMWSTIQNYGGVLSDCCATFAYMFCSDINKNGNEVGYPVEFFAATFDKLHAIVTDSAHLRSRLIERFMIPYKSTSKLLHIPTPLRIASPTYPRRDARRGRPRVIWAGRFDRQKRFDVLIALAARMPDTDFSVWGKPVLDNFNPSHLPANIRLEGVYDKFEDLPLGAFDAWIYTAEWDGVPTILIDAAAAGIPLVGTVVGGTAEILKEGLCGRVELVDDLNGYEAELRYIFNNPGQAWERADRLRGITLCERAPTAYCAALRKLFDGSEALRHG